MRSNVYRGVARGGQRGQMPPPFSRENAIQVYRETNYFLLFSERSAVNIDSNDFDKACYKADILSTYFHDDRLNASEVGQSSICERIGRVSVHLISGRDFRYENFSRATRAISYINIICPPISEILPTPLVYCVCT